MSDNLFVELYAAMHQQLADTLPADETPPASTPAPAQKPNRTPTAMPGLAVQEPDATRGWKLAEGHTFDQAVVARMQARAKSKGYILDVKPMRFLDGRVRHHMTVYHPKGQKMANPTEFYAADQGTPATTPESQGTIQSVRQLEQHLKQQYSDNLEDLTITEPQGASIHLHHIRMIPGHEGQGTGSKIVRAIQEYATTRGLPVTLSASPDSRKKAALERFYRGHGFKRPGRAIDHSLARHTHVWYPAQPEQYAAGKRASSPGQRHLFEAPEPTAPPPEITTASPGEPASESPTEPIALSTLRNLLPLHPEYKRVHGTKVLGHPVTAKVYRVGPTDDQYGRGVFYGGDPESIKGYQGLHPGHEVQEHVVTLKNPLLAGHQHDITREFFKKDYIDIHADLSSKAKSEAMGQKLLDAKIAKEAMRRGHDGIIYMRPALPAKEELVAFNMKTKPRRPKRYALASTMLREYYAQRFADRVVERYAEKTQQTTTGIPAPQPWHITSTHYETLYPKAGKAVDGRRVHPEIPNQESIGATLSNYTPASGVREVGMHHFDPDPPKIYSPAEEQRTRALAAKISQTRALKPLIVVHDAEGPYILEGGHRFDALKLLGAKSFPAKVVFDEDSLHHAAKQAVERGEHVPPEVLAEYPHLQTKPEQYAEQQSRLFDDAGGQPRKEFDETKHQRAGGQFARKFPRVLSKEVQPALPGVDLPPQQRVVTRDRPVGQGPSPTPRPTRSLAAASQYLTDNWETWWGGLDDPAPEPDVMEKEFAQHTGPTVTLQEANEILRNAGVGKHLPPETDLLAGTKSFQKHGDAIPSDNLLFHAVHAMKKQNETDRRLAILEQAGDSKALKFTKPGSPVHFIVHPAAHSDYQGQWQITRFDDRGPSGHQYHKTKEEAIGAAIGAHPNSYWNEGGRDYQLTEKYTLQGDDTPFRARDQWDLYVALFNAAHGLDRYAVEESDDYRGEHRAPMRDNGAPLHNVTANEIYPADVYSHNGPRYYGDGSHHDAHSFGIVHGLRDRPAAGVKVYRAVSLSNEDQIAQHTKRKSQIMARGSDDPKEFDYLTAEIARLQKMPPEPKRAINAGDWVTINRQYAKEHGESALGGKYRILSRTVPAAHLYTNGDSIHEWGYDPSDSSAIEQHKAARRERNLAKVRAQLATLTPEERQAKIEAMRKEQFSAALSASLDRYGLSPQSTATTSNSKPQPVAARPPKEHPRTNAWGGTPTTTPTVAPSPADHEAYDQEGQAATLAPPRSSVLPPHHQALHQALLAKGWHRTPEEDRMFSALNRRIDELEDRGPQQYAAQQPAQDPGTHLFFHATDPASARALPQEGIRPEAMNRRDAGFFGPGFYASRTPQNFYGRSLVAIHLRPDARVLEVGDLVPKAPAPWHQDFLDSYKRRILKHRPDMEPARLQEIMDNVTPGHPTFDHLSYKNEVGSYARSEGFDASSFANGQETVIHRPEAVAHMRHIGGLKAATAYRAKHDADRDASQKTPEPYVQLGVHAASGLQTDPHPGPQQYSQQLRTALLDRYQAVADPYSQFRELVALSAEVERYKAHDSPGQRHLFVHDVENEPRDASGEWTTGAPHDTSETPAMATGESSQDAGQHEPAGPPQGHESLASDRPAEPSREAPQPGSNEDLVARFQRGDRQAGDQLIEQNRRFIYGIARRYARNPSDLEDLWQEGAIAMVQMARSFDPERGTKFTTPAQVAIERHLAQVVGKQARRRGVWSQQAEDQEGQPLQEPVAPPTPDPVETTERAAGIRHAIESLPNPRHRLAIQMYYGIDQEPRTQEEIAREFGVKKQRVSALLASLLPRIEQQVASYYAQQRVNGAFLERYAQQVGTGEQTSAPALPHTETPEFKEWFGESHVRHPKTGQPLVVYHGTKQAGFRVFDKSQQGQSVGRKRVNGFYFTNHPLGAQTYSGTRDKAELSDDEEDRKPGNYAVHLSLQNPRHIDFEGRGWDGSGPDDHDPYFNIDRLAKEAMEDGHDGLIAHNINDEGEHGHGYGWGDTTYVAFHPHQIKSVDNRGTWDRADERIDYDQEGEPAVNYTQAFHDAFVERYGFLSTVGAGLQALGQRIGGQPQPPAPATPKQTEIVQAELVKPGPAAQSTPRPHQRVADNLDLRYAQTPAINHAREVLTALHNPEALHARAHPEADRLAKIETGNAQRGTKVYDDAYSRHIETARKNVHQQLSGQLPEILNAADQEIQQQVAMHQQAKDYRADRASRLALYPEGHPTRDWLVRHLAEVDQDLANHRQKLQEAHREIQGRRDNIPPPASWTNPRLEREQTKQDIQDHRRRVKELERAGQNVAGPSGDPIADERDAGFRQSVKERHVKWKQQPAVSPPKTAKAKPADPAVQQPADPAGWMAHVDQAVHRATAPAQQDATVRDIALRNWKADYPTLSPKGQAAFRDYVERARVPAHEQLKGAATQRLDAAEQWFTAQGIVPPPELAKHRQKIEALQPPRSNAGYADAVPVAVGPGGERKPITEATLARQEAQASKQETARPTIRPEEREKTKTQQASENNRAWAAEYGMTPKQYHSEASRFWEDRVTRAQSLEGLRQDLASQGLTRQRVNQLENSGRDVDSVKNLDTATDMAAARGLPDMTTDELFELAKRGPIEIPGPHQDEWHQEFADWMRRQGRAPHSERQASEQDREPGLDDEEPPPEDSDEPVPFTARRHHGTFADLYSALFWAAVTGGQPV